MTLYLALYDYGYEGLSPSMSSDNLEELKSWCRQKCKDTAYRQHYVIYKISPVLGEEAEDIWATYNDN